MLDAFANGEIQDEKRSRKWLFTLLGVAAFSLLALTLYVHPWTDHYAEAVRRLRVGMSLDDANHSLRAKGAVADRQCFASVGPDLSGSYDCEFFVDYDVAWGKLPLVVVFSETDGLRGVFIPDKKKTWTQDQDTRRWTEVQTYTECAPPDCKYRETVFDPRRVM